MAVSTCRHAAHVVDVSHKLGAVHRVGHAATRGVRFPPCGMGEWGVFRRRERPPPVLIHAWARFLPSGMYHRQPDRILEPLYTCTPS